MLYLVPTPIGNLRDITLRALDVLKEADVIVCEDTRRTRQLLDHYGVTSLRPSLPMISFHEHSGAVSWRRILKELTEDKMVALVTDSGMPAISDPGFEIVRAAIRSGIRVEVLPGATAFVTALVASGLAVDSFSFFGFLPARRGQRRKFLERLKEREETLIFYESPYRVVKMLEDVRAILGEREVAVARELTKKFEEILRGRISEILEKIKTRKPLGEYVMIVAGAGRKRIFS